jgi:polyphosphate kinase
VIQPALAAHGIHLLTWEQLTESERAQAAQFFKNQVFPVLTPLAVDPAHPFPFISNLSTSLGVLLRHPEREEDLFARVKVPKALPQWVKLSEDASGRTFRFVSLLDLIRDNIHTLFPEMTVLDVMPFRLTRNAEIERDEGDIEDLLEMVEEELRQRRFAEVVRLEHGPRPNAKMLQLLREELELGEEDVYGLPAELDYTDLGCIASLNLSQLRYPPWIPQIPKPLGDVETDIFAAIRAGDIFVHHPYESFKATVERFMRAAADDPKVLAIKMTVYRTGDESPFIQYLIRAAGAGKQVACLVELKARFDEERNIYWAHVLEKAGIHVVYGIVGLKTHTKTTLVIRQEPDGLRAYAHIGTGNYNMQTAKLYTDLGLFTCDAALTEDLVELFNYLTGRSLKRDYRKLLVAPVNLKERTLAMLEREIEHRRAGRPARIVAKMNSLEDRDTCKVLYRASQEGVPVDLIIRGFCCLRPGVPGLSENIRVTSVIGRFLEHSRIFYFRNGAKDEADGEFYIGSADWMYRNLLARVEAVTPIESRAGREKCWEILQLMLRDHRQAWDLLPDGRYVQRAPPPGAAPESVEVLGTHAWLMNLTRKRLGGG